MTHSCKEQNASCQDEMDRKMQEYRDRFSGPTTSVANGFVDEIIRPRNTRWRIARAINILASKQQKPTYTKKHDNMPQ